MYKKDENGEFILDADGNKIPEESSNPEPNNPNPTESEKQVKTLNSKIEGLQREVEFYKNEVERITHIRDSVIEEKRDLQEKYKAIKDSFEGMNPDQIKSLIETAKRDGKDKDEELRTILSAREKTLREDIVVPLEKENSDLRKLNENLRAKLSSKIIETEITQEAMKFGARPNALRIISQDFSDRIEVDENGDKYYLDKQGIRTETLNYESEFIKHRTENPFLYDPNSGASARPNSGYEKDTETKNPWSKEYFSRSEQFRIIRENPKLAEKLKSSAG